MLLKKKKTGIPLEASEKVMVVISYIVMSILALCAILPILHVLSKSFSSASAVTSGSVLFWPVDIQFETMEYVLKETTFLHSLKNTVIVTVVGTIISMAVTITTAYPLSKPSFKGRKVFIMLYIISMVFFGGIIPAYMVVRTLGIIDTFAALILPFFIVHFNMFIVKNYFEGLPESVEESAKIDGASDVRILISIVCPMSKPVLATVAMLYAVNYWNNYFHAVMYTNSTEMQTLQLFTYNTISNTQTIVERLVAGNFSNVSIDGIVSAVVVLSLIPIVALYPFVQRYMVQGITIGSVKG
ncbi:carbohydrate ABC transporter permease [Ruminiclostridium cellulolyticum]|uniref:Binding-protein-dependent transport systems inner membrane component n=1 Tax=Ruminiclostridium cellulolyticum (strain ATCC 35319 / DSM 5812 / JCM 6584 / H10) TaxID=394503 RepID=B8I950_RUMCH|nr:carbohydrate ABC transporter permease [Ruminiclostridium cellulolyticum]ACL75310.1 binding-protein-dependent transport systems inner membrane component [Ruminiclostridium cellulolyticum H10]